MNDFDFCLSKQYPRCVLMSASSGQYCSSEPTFHDLKTSLITQNALSMLNMRIHYKRSFESTCSPCSHLYFPLLLQAFETTRIIWHLPFTLWLAWIFYSFMICYHHGWSVLLLFQAIQTNPVQAPHAILPCWEKEAAHLCHMEAL